MLRRKILASSCLWVKGSIISTSIISHVCQKRQLKKWTHNGKSIIWFHHQIIQSHQEVPQAMVIVPVKVTLQNIVQTWTTIKIHIIMKLTNFYTIFTWNECKGLIHFIDILLFNYISFEMIRIVWFYKKELQYLMNICFFNQEVKKIDKFLCLYIYFFNG